jgi:ubiquinone/menaquinone biosynthesis C-methylase UbiE
VNQQGDVALEKADYGIDAPGVVRNLLLIAVLLLAAAWFLPVLRLGPVNFKLRPTALATGSVCLLEGLLMLLYAKNGKFHHRDRMLGMLQWTGTETVLDVGTGRGLLMIGAAKRLSTGKAIGIDVWNAQDLSGNRAERTLRNAEIEGVSGRVEVRDGDAVAMSFADGTFDVVLSNLCLHNIPAAEKRDQACREIARVLKPGGTALISDYKNTSDYQRAFQAAGLEARRTGMYVGRVFPPLRIVIAKKPAAALGA